MYSISHRKQGSEDKQINKQTKQLLNNSDKSDSGDGIYDCFVLRIATMFTGSMKIN